ncbi:FAD-dependent oxidoreductase [Apilactobacillus timberlakei]|uniref:FAD-dependent oxidoreductase n=1 Tax=Apilactobacillus timberlakei TaxID=2008380 RepID=UPI001125F48D|nr:FAD-dependent oxidoreductase [Apilactobacillus timberlakei]TPR19569.1 FAD-dependent oxidoreductase [Apilactobacillus timberlakei]TPR20546.1 FAD-dependent oxidoreductase [Apilactobacillus timberlakei]TPR22590.1 FAD-dependent oxidoreductase [Apilactobacillus timberlakei]
MKVIVLGSSHGGYDAVRQILSDAPDTEIQWYEKGDFISFLSCGMQLYLEGVVKHVNDVSYAKPDQMHKAGVDVFVKQEISAIDPANHSVHVLNHNDGSERDEHYDKLIISPGANPASLGVKGEDLQNIYKMRGRDWAIKLKEKTVDPDVKNVAVIGSGYIGIEAAEVFAKAGMHVSIIEFNERLLGTYLDKEFTDTLTKVMKDHNVDFYGNQGVAEYKGEDGKVKTAITSKGNEIPADLVVEAAGIRPNTKWLDGIVDLDDHGFIKNNEYMQTSEPDIYAIGDATLVPFAPTGEKSVIALATNARREGRTAAMNALGQEHAMVPVSGSSALSVFDYKFASTGIKEGTASRFGVKTQSTTVTDTFRPPFIPDKAGNAEVLFKLTYNPETHEILGGQVMSKQDATQNMNTISLAIQAHMKVEDLAYADFFFQPGFDRPWNIMNVVAQQALKDLK